MDSFSLEALAVPSAHKFMVLVSDRQQFPPSLILKSTAYEQNPKICLPRRGVSRYYLQICFWSAPLEAPLSAPCGPTLAPHAASHIRFSTPDTEARLCAPEGRSLRRFAFAVTCKRIEGEAACAPPRCIFACAYMSLTRSNPNADTEDVVTLLLSAICIRLSPDRTV